MARFKVVERSMPRVGAMKLRGTSLRRLACLKMLPACVRQRLIVEPTRGLPLAAVGMLVNAYVALAVRIHRCSAKSGRRAASCSRAKSLEAAVLFGDGSNKPTGIFNTAPTTADDDASPQRLPDVIESVATSADVANDIIELYFTLKPEYRRNASFVMSSATLAAVRKLRDSNGSRFSVAGQSLRGG